MAFIQQRYLTGVFRDCLFTTFLVEGINKASPFQSRWSLQIMKKHSFFRRAMYLQSLPMTLFPKLTLYRTLPMLDWITNQISGWVLRQMLDRWMSRLSWQTFLFKNLPSSWNQSCGRELIGRNQTPFTTLTTSQGATAIFDWRCTNNFFTPLAVIILLEYKY